MRAMLCYTSLHACLTRFQDIANWRLISLPNGMVTINTVLECMCHRLLWAICSEFGGKRNVCPLALFSAPSRSTVTWC
jgi:hypothetical protein